MGVTIFCFKLFIQNLYTKTANEQNINLLSKPPLKIEKSFHYLNFHEIHKSCLGKECNTQDHFLNNV